MSNEASDYLNDLFADHDFVNTNELSNCCNAPAAGEIFRGFGRCGDCYEMAEFYKEQTDD